MLIDSLVSVLKAIGKDIKTIADSVDKKADRADLSTKRDISNATFSNNIVVDNGEWSGLELKTSNGKYMQIEVSPDRDNRMGILMRKNSNGATVALLNIPMRTGTLATTDQIPEGGLGNAPFRQNNTSNAHLIKNNYWGLWTSTGTLNFDWFTGNKTPYITFDAGGIKIRGTLVRHVVDSWHNPANGAYWREWSDGWLEEGGYCPISGTPSIVTVSYHKPFKNPPIMTLTDVTKQDTTGGADVYKTPTTTNFSVILVRNNRQGFYWKAEGYKA